MTPEAMNAAIAGQGHASDLVESYFVRANDPRGSRALWLKATYLSGPVSSPTCALWWVYFDGTRVFGGRSVELASSARAEQAFSIGGSRFEVHGQMGNAAGESDDQAVRWALRWSPMNSPLARPMQILPFQWMLTANFPRSKLVTPAPLLQFSGHIDLGKQRINIDNWIGMQGHNWGQEHAPEYAWGQAWFGQDEPECVVEGFTARIRVAGKLSPRLSCLVVRTLQHEYRFDRFWRLSSQRGWLGDGSWNLDMTNGHARARLWLHATPQQSACLRYTNPNGIHAYCFNSKTARARLVLESGDGMRYEGVADNAALEFLRPDADARFGAII